ncbi:hypothetical protein FRC17_001294 [Serendipita sp. 399]|nr:hypothetical protein FRC17_001294 [Serendipita sp. 399]
MSVPEAVDEPVRVDNEGPTEAEIKPVRKVYRRDIGHRLPPSKATHPRDRWDMYFVYMFIRRFTTLKEDIPSFINVTDLENAILDDSGKVNVLLEQVILRFILNLRPNTRNTSSDQIPSTLSSVLHEFLKDKDRPRARTVFWNYEQDMNCMPAKDTEGELWSYSWEVKLDILRQLVDWQLEYSASVRDLIDTAWQYRHKSHKKKVEPPKPAPEPGEPGSRESLQVVPLGQDQNRLRFWAADDSPRLYTSTNPWKTGCVFRCVAQTLDEYIGWIEELRTLAPPEADEGRFKDARHEVHWDLIYTLELRVDTIVQSLKDEKQLRETLALEAEQIAAGILPPPSSTIRKKITVDEEDAIMHDVVGPTEEEAPQISGRSQSSDEMLHTPDTPPETNPDPDYSEELNSQIQRGPIDSTFDDDWIDVDTGNPSAGVASSTVNAKKKKSKRRRPHALPVVEKPTRVSARRKQQSIGMEGVQPSDSFNKEESFDIIIDTLADSTRAASETAIAALSTSQAQSIEMIHGLKGSKGRNTKYWYFDEVGEPSKRPAEMVDDPDAVLKRRRAKGKEEQSIEVRPISQVKSK